MLHQCRAILRKRVDIRRAEEWHAAIVQRGALVLVKDANVAEAKIVAEDKDDVWARRTRCRSRGGSGFRADLRRSTRKRPYRQTRASGSGQSDQLTS